jgi:hypothetical protein
VPAWSSLVGILTDDSTNLHETHLFRMSVAGNIVGQISLTTSSASEIQIENQFFP